VTAEGGAGVRVSLGSLRRRPGTSEAAARGGVGRVRQPAAAAAEGGGGWGRRRWQLGGVAAAARGGRAAAAARQETPAVSLISVRQCSSQSDELL